MHSPLPPRQHPPSRAGEPTCKPPAPRSATAMGACTSSVGWFRPRPPREHARQQDKQICPSKRSNSAHPGRHCKPVHVHSQCRSSTTENTTAPPPADALAITLDRKPLALRSTRNRPRTAVRRGAARPPAKRPTSCLSWRWSSPIPRSVMPLVVLAAELSWFVDRPYGVCPSGIQRSGTSPCSTMPGRQRWRRPPVRVQPAVSTHPVPSSGARLSGRPVSARPVSRHWVRRPGSGVRPSGVRSVRCPAGWCPPRPSGRVRLVSHKAVVLGTGRGGTAPAPRERAQVPGGCRVVERLGSTAEPARTRATPPRSRMVGGGPGPGRVRAAAVLDAGLPGRPGRRAERPSPAAARGTGGGRTARLPHRPRGCRPRDGWVTTVSGCRGACRPRGRAWRGRWGCRRGWGVRPQRGPGWQRAFLACCRQRCDLREWVVGLPGLEPGTSSLSAKCREPLC
jgi:hypothetical protein